MKKILSVLLILMLMLVIVACGNKEKMNEINEVSNSGDQVEKPIVKYFNEEDLNKFGTIQTINLPEDDTTGYEWIYTIDNAEVVEIVRDEFLYDEGVDVLDGGKGNRICELKGVGSGETIVYFTHLNPYEEVIEPKETVKLYIEVNENNEIAVTSEIH